MFPDRIDAVSRQFCLGRFAGRLGAFFTFPGRSGFGFPFSLALRSGISHSFFSGRRNIEFLAHPQFSFGGKTVVGCQFFNGQTMLAGNQPQRIVFDHDIDFLAAGFRFGSRSRRRSRSRSSSFRRNRGRSRFRGQRRSREIRLSGSFRRGRGRGWTRRFIG